MRVHVYNTGIVCNELICGYANVLHTSSSFRPHIHTDTHILIPFEDSEPTGLKVDIACKKESVAQVQFLDHMDATGEGPFCNTT